MPGGRNWDLRSPDTPAQSDRVIVTKLVHRVRTVRQGLHSDAEKGSLMHLSDRQLRLIEEALLRQLYLMQRYQYVDLNLEDELLRQVAQQGEAL